MNKEYEEKNTQVNLSISFNKNCKDAKILTPDEVIIDNAPAFFRTIREQSDKLFKNIKVPTVAEAASLEHGELPTIIGTGNYNNSRSANNLTDWNRLVWLDIDCTNKEFKKAKSLEFFTEELNKLRRLLIRESKVYAYCLSKSGKGLRVIYKIPDVHKIDNVAQYYTDVYMTFKKVIDTFLINNNLSFFEVDEQAADISHAFAIVADPEAACFHYTVDTEKFKQLLSDYKAKEKKFKPQYKAVITPGAIDNIKLADLKLNPTIQLNDYTTRFQAANVLSYLFGNDGLDYYLSIVEGKKTAEYKGFYNHGLSKRNSYKDNEVNMLLLTADKFFDLKLPKEYIKEDEETQVNTISKPLIFKNYLTELKSEVIHIIKQDKFIVIDAPTNTGKTTLSKELSEHFKIDFIAPTQAIVKQQEKDIRVVIGNTILSNEDKEALMLAAPYESIGKLSVRNSDLLIVDEAHHLIEDYTRGYRKDSVRRILDSFSKYKYVVLLSGTPDGLSDLEGFTLYKFRKENSQKVKLYDYLTFADVVSKPGFLAIYLNDKEKGIEYKRKLISEFNYIENEIALINSDEKEGDIYKGILSEQLLNNNIRCIIATKLIADGVNINNQYNNVNIFFPEVSKVSYNEIKQFSTRFRKVNVELYTSAFPDKATVTPQHIPSLNELEVAAIKMTETYISSFSDNKYFYNRLQNLNDIDSYFRDEVEKGITHDTIKKIVVDEMYLIRKSIERNNLLFRNIKSVRRDILNELDIIYIDKLTLENDEDVKEINGGVLKSKKEAFRSNIENFVSLLNSNKLTKGQKSLVDNYKLMLKFGVDEDYALNLITSTKNKSYIPQIIKSIMFNYNRKHLEDGTANIDSSDNVGTMIVLMAVYGCFKGQTGKVYTPEQFKDFIDGTIESKQEQWPGLAYIKVTNQYVMSCFNTVFDMDSKISKDENRKSYRLYTIKSVKDDNYFKISKPLFETTEKLFDIN